MKWIVLPMALAGCSPAFHDDPPLITSPRVLAVIADPPEVRPCGDVTVHAVAAGRDISEASYAFCTPPATVGDPRPVASDCIDEPGIPLDGNGADATGTVPADACARFGPDPP